MILLSLFPACAVTLFVCLYVARKNQRHVGHVQRIGKSFMPLIHPLHYLYILSVCAREQEALHLSL